MAQNTRQWARQELYRGAHNLEMALGHLDAVGSEYCQAHPEITVDLAAIHTSIELIKEALDKFATSI
jgi:hypothetical protein